MPQPATLAITSSGTQGAVCLRLAVGGAWSLAAPPDDAARKTAMARLREPGVACVILAAEGLGDWDSTLAIFVAGVVRACRERNLSVDTSGLPAGLTRLVDLSFAVPERAGAARGDARPGLLERIGEAVLALPKPVGSTLDFIGEVAFALYRLASGKADMRRRDLLQFMSESGSSALPIVSLISLLVGLILAFVGAVQLRVFGAQIYVASLVAIAMVRVMGAIMTGITMAGRTGASYAAILGTMQVNEEVDALATMGLRPVEQLVLPRLLALVVMLPLLTVYADLMGMAGGFIVGVFMLDLSPMEYLNATREAMTMANVWIGITHGAVFGVVVALCGCYHGMRCGRSAAAVGAATTAAVVSGIVSIIVCTAFITVACEVLGI
ncbi:ABC transporter permease [Desulfovibrio oxamicus]|uniref:ABC transporter permease n=1 Tax=Nitratidesulfovibrio oxamicus TaxID=32016 RepID=A0ABS0J0K2_9BACT|nr:ABC transporter permease [Nitratidesulfovibrio oxamicus]MBG3875957.1 ABC transporter permease [Nitratidesulfovibrio oxamicus]